MMRLPANVRIRRNRPANFHVLSVDKVSDGRVCIRATNEAIRINGEPTTKFESLLVSMLNIPSKKETIDIARFALENGEIPLRISLLMCFIKGNKERKINGTTTRYSKGLSLKNHFIVGAALPC